MLTEKPKKTLSIRPITLLVCFACLIGLSASATYLMVRVDYQNRLDNKNREILAVQKDNKALADQNTELMNSLQKLEDKYSKLDAQLSEIEAQRSDRQTSEQKYSGFGETQVLKPRWVNSGETTQAFDGSLRIVLYASDKEQCPKDSAAVGYLSSDTGKNKLCLRTGKPEEFTYQGKNYLFNLSGIAATADVSRYYISISEVSGTGTP